MRPFALALLLAACTAPPEAEPAREPYVETIPGTTVAFEMVPLPGTRLYVGHTEVTWDEFEAWYLTDEEEEADAVARPTPFYEAHDRGWGRGKRPAVGFSRHAAEEYCRWLSRRTGKTYRLPTEAEWERACGRDPEDVARYAWFAGNSDFQTHQVGKKSPNEYGLYDMLGNAMEYCAGEEIALRGGSWQDDEVSCKSRATYDEAWNMRDPQRPQSVWWLTDGPFCGFRVVCEAE
jgi:formylglycine-generating enzyme required for sulfatase activity